MAGLLLAACTAGPLFRPDTYTVRRGDTLYSIAWRYGVDWRRLARWNGIGPPYDIYPGDVLHLDGRTRSVASSTSSSSSSAPSGGASRDGGQRTARASSPAPRDRPAPMASDLDWRWPVGGKVLRGYSGSHARRGIDIAGSMGDAVRAAAPGRVVYSGSGLKGYGNLVIIKHDDRFLSAYGFNRRLRVGQGETVGAGQHIADVGLGPENRAMLYFEIRRDGEPVDPQRLLPRR
ncbi:peptidase M23B [Salinisphaera sp. PC39]|uniref:peptidoglycan DD-metalloendopeptidase family protein n=1 Tax=Salinisphaera sp. PC39 TaxID=1304156 RepID=UPI00333F0ACB